MFRILIMFLLLVLRFSIAQVPNDKIDQRHQLKLDGNTTVSTTANSSVEWRCIAKALTNKCLVYHNDQWFSFQVEENGNYYLNITNQQCKKLKGLQVILLEGNPC
jgi:hypothetical protein